MPQPRVNLLIACWGGLRYTPHNEYDIDRAYYLKLQLDSLSRFKHNLSQITFISNGGEPEYLNYLKTIPYTVMERENLGISYGAYAAAIQKYPDFDYYIFLEDDYLFVRDNFDQILVETFESIENCGYLASVAINDISGYPYPALSSGIVSRKCLDKLGDDLPGTQADHRLPAMYAGADWQMAWGRIVRFKAGMGVHSLSQFKWPFDNPDGKIVIYNDNPGTDGYLIVPARIYNLTI